MNDERYRELLRDISGVILSSQNDQRARLEAANIAIGATLYDLASGGPGYDPIEVLQILTDEQKTAVQTLLDFLNGDAADNVMDNHEYYSTELELWHSQLSGIVSNNMAGGGQRRRRRKTVRTTRRHRNRKTTRRNKRRRSII